jgi:signal peptidase
MTPPSDDGDEVAGGNSVGNDAASASDDGGDDTGEQQGDSSAGEQQPPQGPDATRQDATAPRAASDGPDRDRRRVGTNSSDPPPTAEPDDDEPEPILKEVGISIVAVLLVGVYIFMISGVWPPMVAVESGSMEPNMNVNDLVFVMDNERFQPEQAQNGTGVVTAREGRETDYRQFGGPGDVIVFNPNGNNGRTPIIHRAMFWVQDSERWVDRANPEYLGGAETCEEVAACPAEHAGFITKGDNNPTYDQAGGDQYRTGVRVQQFDPVKPEWIVGTAEIRIPRLGWLRLRFQ